LISARLKDKICIVTGGGSGICRATALLFAREGARLAIAEKRKDAAQVVSQECARHGVTAIAIEMDVPKAADAHRMVDETIKAFGRLDVLINDAGYGIAGSVVETDEQAWDDLMSVNMRRVFLCAKPTAHPKGAAAITRAIAMDHVGDGAGATPLPPAPSTHRTFPRSWLRVPMRQRSAMGWRSAN
jgi:NAD(P)-dependent dehydrogenase (short-subunit alcohol dehydrogenase family)